MNGSKKPNRAQMNPCLCHRSEGFALTEYDIPGCVEDGAWMLWESSSVAAVTDPDLGSGHTNAAYQRWGLSGDHLGPLGTIWDQNIQNKPKYCFLY